MKLSYEDKVQIYELENKDKASSSFQKDLEWMLLV